MPDADKPDEPEGLQSPAFLVDLAKVFAEHGIDIETSTPDFALAKLTQVSVLNYDSARRCADDFTQTIINDIVTLARGKSGGH